MANLKVKFLGVEFKNPIVAASAEPTSDLKNLNRVVKSGVGGLIMKTMTDNEAMRNLSYQTRWRFLDETHSVCKGRIPRLFTFYGRTGLEVKEPQSWIKDIKEIKKTCQEENCVLIGSIASTDIQGWVNLARLCEDTGLEIIELNFGCPHPSQMEGTKTGMLIGQDKELAAEIVKAVSASVSSKLIIKLTPQVADVTEIAKAVVNAGASAVTLTNRYVGFLVNIEKAEPYIFGTAGVGGPWVKPLTLRWIYQVYKDLGVPITGTNGVYDARDVIEFMMAGATLVQMCSAVMANGYSWFTRTITELNTLLDRYGYKTAEEIIGIASKKALSYAEMAKLPKEKAVVDETLCTGCQRCMETCFYNAIRTKDGKIVIENCWGCGICTCVCPEGAITLV